MKLSSILILGLALTVVTGCDSKTGSKSGPPGMGKGGAMLPTEVGMVTVEPEKTASTVELPGRVNAVRVAEVRARVTGIIEKRLFDEGAAVQAGQVLFEIDPAPLQAVYDSAKASLARAEATREQAQADAKRKAALVKVNGVSQQAYEQAKTTALEAEADVLAAKADLETAALNLGYTKVTAPISGRIGKALVTEGALASSSDATKMAVIQQIDPIYVDFTQSSAEMLKLRRQIESGKLEGISSKKVSVSLVLEDGFNYAETGRIVFSDISVDENTGTVALRSEFPNPQKVLLPGMFVRGRVEVAIDDQALTVPQRGIARDANGQASVLVVNAQNQVEQRDIQTGSFWHGKWIVTSGLKAGDRVIVDGLQKVRVGATVNPVPAGTASTNAPAAFDMAK